MPRFRHVNIVLNIATIPAVLPSLLTVIQLHVYLKYHYVFMYVHISHMIGSCFHMRLKNVDKLIRPFCLVFLLLTKANSLKKSDMSKKVFNFNINFRCNEKSCIEEGVLKFYT